MNDASSAVAGESPAVNSLARDAMTMRESVRRETRARFLQHLEASHPLWHEFYPRAYVGTGGWNSPKLAAVDFVCSVSIPVERMDYAMRCVAETAMASGQHGHPVFFVARELLSAMRITDPPEGLMVDDVAMPFPAMTFMMPTGALVHPEDGEVNFITLAKVDGGPRLIFTAGSFGINWAGTTGANVCSLSENISNLVGSPVDAAAEYLDLIPSNESQFLSALLKIAVNITLAMTARSELVQRGTLQKKASSSSRPDLWTPNIIGGRYRVARDPESSAHHASPRLHWRRGHFRFQVFGAGRIGRKVIWIEPCLVTPREEAA